MTNAMRATLVAALASSCGPDPAQISRRLDSPASGRLTASEVLPTGPACAPTGAHAKHAAYACTVCHVCGGVLAFDAQGPAVAPGRPLPSFDANAKTCSNVACHGMYSGTYSYLFPGGDGEPEAKTASYQGNGGSTPSWYSIGAGCAACHGNPPANGGGLSGAYTWHSGAHGNQAPDGPRNQCQLCHPDASGSGGVGSVIVDRTLHANGSVDVLGRFTISCFGCH